MKPSFKIASHLGALVIGALLAGTVPGMISGGKNGGDSATHDGKAGNEGGSKTGKRGGKSTTGGEGNSRAAAYRKAWAALQKEPLNTMARMAAQKALLQEWAEIDLEGAINAFLGEAWDPVMAGKYYMAPMSDAFAKVFQEHPLDAWKVLSGEKMKMARQLLGETWIGANTQKNPGLIASMLGEMPGNLQGEALARLFDNGEMPSATLKELLGKIGAAGTPEQVEKWMLEACRHVVIEQGDAATLSGKWAEMPAGGERTQVMAAWASKVGSESLENFEAEWAKVPEEDKGQAARMLLSQTYNESPALLQVIERAIETGQWSALGTPGVADKLRGYKGASVDERAEWALTLPERDELIGIFNLSVSEKLLANPQEGRKWLESLPAGSWQRERGFVEMMLGSIWVRGDAAAAQRAIDGITDERARQNAETARYDWQLITEQKNMIRLK